MSTTLSIVQFLNTTPLVYALQKGLIKHDFRMSYDVPSVCAQKLKNNQADSGIIPSIEYARSEEPYWIVPNISISSRGSVQSILLFHTVSFEHIRSVALDTSSRTSVALTHVILKEKYALDFKAIDHEPDLDGMLSVADAALVIGDPALEYSDRQEPRKDLGHEWTDMTGLPFVYAFWAGRKNAFTATEIDILIQAKEIGLTSLTEIANEYARSHLKTAAFYESYLRHHLQYPLGPEEQAGLKEFYKLAKKIGLIDYVPDLRFYSG